MKRVIITLLATALPFCGSLFGSDVTLNLLDQNGALISGSQFVILTSPSVTVAQSQTIALSPGTYTVRIFPGVNGQVQGNVLFREETITVPTGNVVIDFEWTTASFTFNLHDQQGAPIPASRFRFFRGPGNSPFGPTFDFPSNLVLPVTDDPAHPDIQGLSKDGYSVLSFPGILGTTQGGSLMREELPHELPLSGTVTTFQWATASFTFNLHDQQGAPIPASRFRFFRGPGNSPFGPTFDFPSTQILPTTDDPNIYGMLKDGYVIMSVPGLNGNTQNELIKEESPIELSVNGTSNNFTWQIVTGAIHIVDDSEIEVCGASMYHDRMGTINSGDIVSMPITDETVYPTMFGNYLDGFTNFQIQAPPNPLTGFFTFEFLPPKVVAPLFVTINGNEYGLRFDIAISQFSDSDNDGFCKSEDCDDNDAAVNPNAIETCNGIDDNCDGQIDEGFDLDGDGFTICQNDCNDSNAAVNPNVSEVCGNNIDDDCDGDIDEDCGPPLEVFAGGCQPVYYGYAPFECDTLEASVMGGVSPYSYSWETGETTATILVCPIDTTAYVVTVTDANGNTSTDTVIVEVIDVRCGNNLNKVLICHNPSGNSNTLCISPNAVPAHLNNHGDYLGPCGTVPCVPPANSLIHSNTGGISELPGIEAIPNPFSSEIKINIHLNGETNARLEIFDCNAKVVKTFLSGNVDDHEDTFVWETQAIPAGIYYVRLITGENVLVKKILKIR